jgi:hypothetical protein
MSFSCVSTSFIAATTDVSPSGSDAELRTFRTLRCHYDVYSKWCCEVC